MLLEEKKQLDKNELQKIFLHSQSQKSKDNNLFEKKFSYKKMLPSYEPFSMKRDSAYKLAHHGEQITFRVTRNIYSLARQNVTQSEAGQGYNVATQTATILGHTAIASYALLNNVTNVHRYHEQMRSLKKELGVTSANQVQSAINDKLMKHGYESFGERGVHLTSLAKRNLHAMGFNKNGEENIFHKADRRLFGELEQDKWYKVFIKNHFVERMNGVDTEVIEGFTQAYRLSQAQRLRLPIAVHVRPMVGVARSYVTRTISGTESGQAYMLASTMMKRGKSAAKNIIATSLLGHKLMQKARMAIYLHNRKKLLQSLKREAKLLKKLEYAKNQGNYYTARLLKQKLTKERTKMLGRKYKLRKGRPVTIRQHARGGARTLFKKMDFLDISGKTKELKNRIKKGFVRTYKGVNRFLSQNILGRTGKFGKGVTSGARGASKVFSFIFDKIGAIFSGFTKFLQAFNRLKTFLFVGGTFVVILIVFLVFISVLSALNIAEAKKKNVVIKEIQACYQADIDKIQELGGNSAVEIVYQDFVSLDYYKQSKINGESADFLESNDFYLLSNGKEILTMMYVKCNFNFSDYKNEDLKKMTRLLWNDTHFIVVQEENVLITPTEGTKEEREASSFLQKGYRVLYQTYYLNAMYDVLRDYDDDINSSRGGQVFYEDGALLLDQGKFDGKLHRIHEYPIHSWDEMYTWLIDNGFNRKGAISLIATAMGSLGVYQSSWVQGNITDWDWNHVPSPKTINTKDRFGLFGWKKGSGQAQKVQAYLKAIETTPGLSSQLRYIKYMFSLQNKEEAKTYMEYINDESISIEETIQTLAVECFEFDENEALNMTRYVRPIANHFKEEYACSQYVSIYDRMGNYISYLQPKLHFAARTGEEWWKGLSLNVVHGGTDAVGFVNLVYNNFFSTLTEEDGMLTGFWFTPDEMLKAFEAFTYENKTDAHAGSIVIWDTNNDGSYDECGLLDSRGLVVTTKDTTNRPLLEQTPFGGDSVNEFVLLSDSQLQEKSGGNIRYINAQDSYYVDLKSLCELEK